MSQFVIGSGQSLAVGGAHCEGGDLTPNNRVFAWSDDHWVVAEPGKPPFYPTEDGLEPRNNIMWNFCKKLQEETGEDVYFVLSGKGETPISEWADGAEQWVNLNTAATDAMASPELDGVTEPDFFLWHQGGSDRTNENYAADFLSLRQRAINAGWLQEDTRVIAGEIYSNNEAKEAILNLIGSGETPWLHFADNDGIPFVGVHPSADGCVEFGRGSYWEAAIAEFNTLHGFFGADHFEFGSDLGEKLFSTSDTLLRAFKGDDKIIATGDDSFLFGGVGDDVFVLHDFGDHTINGSLGYDTLHVFVDDGSTYSRHKRYITVDDDRLTLESIERVRVHYEPYE